jgi:hypothetical protein
MKMKATTRKLMACLTAMFVIAAVMNFAMPPQSAHGIDFGNVIGDLLKIGGIGFVVKQFDTEIDKGINEIMAKNGVMPEAKTKVVPIIRIGLSDPTAVGAAQVVGPPTQVDKVQAVGESQIRIGGIGGRILLPLSTKKAVTKSVRGVGGVGISANIKINI